MAVEEDDEDTVNEVVADLEKHEEIVAGLEFRRMFSGELDLNSAYLDIQSGAGGTEAQDWSEMILRMYLRWAEAHGFKAEVIEASDGEVAPTVGCGQKLVCTDWCVNHRLTPEVVDILLSHRCSFRLKSMTISRLRLTHRICASTYTGPAVQADSTSTVPSLLCA